MKGKQKNSGIHRYHPDPLLALPYYIIGFLVGGAGIMTIFVFASTIELLSIGIGLVLLFVAVWILQTGYQRTYQTHLTVTPESLRFAYFDNEGWVGWNKIRGISKMHLTLSDQQTRWLGYVLELDTYNLAEKLEVWTSVLVGVLPIPHFVRIPERDDEPGEIDWDAFAQTPFGRDLLFYAPHLFDGKLKKVKFA